MALPHYACSTDRHLLCLGLLIKIKYGACTLVCSANMQVQPQKRQRKNGKAAAAAQGVPMQPAASADSGSSGTTAPDNLPHESAPGMAGGDGEAGMAEVTAGELPGAAEGPVHPLSLEWLRDVPEDAAREYLMGVAGGGRSHVSQIAV